MRCLLILRMQRRVELLLLRSLRILVELAGVHRALGFMKCLLRAFLLLRFYRVGRNRLLILVKLAGVLPLLLGSGLRTGMGVASACCGWTMFFSAVAVRTASLAILRLAIPTRPPLKKPVAAALPLLDFPDAGAEP